MMSILSTITLTAEAITGTDIVWSKTKTTNLSRVITAMMFLCSILPQQLCLQCAATPGFFCSADSERCSCSHTTIELEERTHERSPSQLPLDDSNCPHCNIRNIGAVLSPIVEIRQQPHTKAHVASDTEFALVSSRACNVDITSRPPATNTSCFHLRI